MKLSYGDWQPTVKFRIKNFMKRVGKDMVFMSKLQQLHYRVVTKYQDPSDLWLYLGKRESDETKWLDVPDVVTESDEYNEI